MNDIDYIGANELVFNTDKELGVYSGGFSVNSIMMKSGLSPILTINKPLQSGGTNKVSDLFNDLVIPNWALSYSMRGGEYKDESSDSDSEYESDIDDELHDKLLGLVREHDNKINTQNKNKKTRKISISKQDNIKKGGKKSRKISNK
jgi:hypothetical protein